MFCSYACNWVLVAILNCNDHVQLIIFLQLSNKLEELPHHNSLYEIVYICNLCNYVASRLLQFSCHYVATTMPLHCNYYVVMFQLLCN